MAELDCLCGYVFSDVSSHLPQLTFRVDVQEIDDIAVLSENNHQLREIWQCPSCHRLAVAKDVRSIEFDFYRLEEEK